MYKCSIFVASGNGRFPGVPQFVKTGKAAVLPALAVDMETQLFSAGNNTARRNERGNDVIITFESMFCRKVYTIPADAY